MGIERGSTLYPRNSTTVDTGTGIDIRVLSATNTSTSENVNFVQATHTQDNVERTFDPATTTNAVADCNTLQKKGWALRLTEDMTPTDDTDCDAYLPAGSLNVVVNVGMGWSGATPVANMTPVWKVSLWRYNIAADTGTLIASGSLGVTWLFASENNVFKVVTIPVTIASAVTFAAGEVLLLQVGVNTATLSNPISGTITYTFALITDNNGTRISWGSGQSIKQACIFDTNLPTTATLSATDTRATTGDAGLSATATGVGTVSHGQTADAELPVVAALAADVTLTKNADAALPAVATLEASAERTRLVDADLPVVVDRSATVTRAIPPADAELAVTTTLGAEATRGKLTDSTLATTADLQADATRTATTVAALATTVSLQSSVTLGKNADAALAVTAGFGAAVGRGRPLDADLAVTATLLAKALVNYVPRHHTATVREVVRTHAIAEVTQSHTIADKSRKTTVREGIA